MKKRGDRENACCDNRLLHGSSLHTIIDGQGGKVQDWGGRQPSMLSEVVIVLPVARFSGIIIPTA